MKRTSLMMSALLLVVATSVGISSSAHNHDLCSGFVPANDMKIPVGFRAYAPGAKGGLSEAQFNAVIDRAQRLFSADISKAGGTLKVNRRWTDATVNASAQQFGSTWILNMYGGLARHPEITVEGFALVVCHELGHHMGGAPKIEGWSGDNWATNEGGADYYATLKCLRRFFAEDDNKSIIAKATIDPVAQKVCAQEFANEQDQLLCMRNSMAGDSVAGLFMDLRKEKTRPRIDTPDTRVVKQMDDNHPATQCRMDTYWAGAACRVDATVPNSNTDYREGSCLDYNEPGARPRCWFKP
jgi:hypothetical protein